jgi:hypothetical protein
MHTHPHTIKVLSVGRSPKNDEVFHRFKCAAIGERSPHTLKMKSGVIFETASHYQEIQDTERNVWTCLLLLDATSGNQRM